MFRRSSVQIPAALFWFLIAVAGAAAGQTDWHVDDDAALGGDGARWATAFKYLQDALARAALNDRILVAGGTYKPDQAESGIVTPGDREAAFRLVSGVGIFGGYAGLADPNQPDARDIARFETVLSGDLNDDDVIDFPVQWDNAGENSLQVVSGADADDSAVLDGCTIRQGYGVESDASGGLRVDDGSPTVRQCRFILNAGAFGGAVCIRTGQPTISEGTFINNLGSDGGGIYLEGGDPRLVGCQFIVNIGAGVGGGISIRGGAPRLIDCEFRGNISGLFAGAGVSNFFGDPQFERCTFVANDALDFGGGLYNVSGSVSLTDCRFENNIVSDDGFGGGMANLGLPQDPAAATLVDCRFAGNTAFRAGGGLFNSGAGATASLAGCTFTDNRAEVGGGLWNDGLVLLRDCSVLRNTAILGAAGAFNLGDLTIANCAFRDNTAQFASGGAVASSGSFQRLVMMNCLLVGNRAADSGGAIWTQGSRPSALAIGNCTLAANMAATGGGVFNSGSAVSVVNSILWGNSPEQIVGPALATYSDVDGGWAGAGNIDVEPAFLDPDHGDYRLSPASPCIDAACNWGVFADAADLDGDEDRDEITPLDLEREERFVDDGDTPDSGCGSSAIVDMGPYEFGDAGSQPCFGDLNGDEVVGLADLATLLAVYGAPEACDADLNCDGEVGLADLSALLAVYGTICH